MKTLTLKKTALVKPLTLKKFPVKSLADVRISK